MKFTLAQIEVKTGDIKGNTERICQVIKDESHPIDNKRGLVFPEFAVSGYNCGQLFESHEFVDDCLAALNEILAASNLYSGCIFVGCPRYAHPRTEKNGTIRLYNSVFVICQGKILGVTDKILLANDFQHEDRKYFIPGETPNAFELPGLGKVGVLICEDIWRDDHDRDLVGELKLKHPDMETVVCCNFSYFTYTKHHWRQKLLKSISKDHKVNIIYVNCVGVGDIGKNVIVYDGQSLAYNKYGLAAEPLGAYKEEVTTIDFDYDAFFEFDDSVGHEMPHPMFQTKEYLDWKYAPLWDAMCYAGKNFQDQCHIPNALVSVSGGLDSAIMAVLAQKSLGADRCRFLSAPSIYNGDTTKSIAQHIADKLGVHLHWFPIINTETALFDTIEGVTGHERTNGMAGCAEATLRSVLALTLCHEWKATIWSTGNHTENILGWATFHDVGSIGLIQLIGDLTKTELYELAEWINMKYGETIIPESLYDGKVVPMAELADSKEDPFDYFLMSGICAEIIRHRKTVKQLMNDFDSKTLTPDYFPSRWADVYGYDRDVFESNAKDALRRSKISVYKSAQSAPILILSPRARGFSARETLINHY